MIAHLKALGVSGVVVALLLMLAEGFRTGTWFNVEGLVTFFVLVAVVDIWVYREWFGSKTRVERVRASRPE